MSTCVTVLNGVFNFTVTTHNFTARRITSAGHNATVRMQRCRGRPHEQLSPRHERDELEDLPLVALGSRRARRRPRAGARSLVGAARRWTSPAARAVRPRRRGARELTRKPQCVACAFPHVSARSVHAPRPHPAPGAVALLGRALLDAFEFERAGVCLREMGGQCAAAKVRDCAPRGVPRAAGEPPAPRRLHGWLMELEHERQPHERQPSAAGDNHTRSAPQCERAPSPLRSLPGLSRADRATCTFSARAIS